MKSLPWATVDVFYRDAMRHKAEWAEMTETYFVMPTHFYVSMCRAAHCGRNMLRSLKDYRKIKRKE